MLFNKDILGKASYIMLLKTKLKLKDNEACIIKVIKANCKDLLLVITWKLIEEHI
jgi:hypothetical protein